MIIFKSHSDLRKLHPDDPAKPVMKELVEMLIDGFYYAVYLGTDDYGMGFVIPNAPWIDGRLRETLESILD